MRYRKAALETRSIFSSAKCWKAGKMTGKRRYRLLLKASRIAFVCAAVLCLLLLPNVGQTGSQGPHTFLCKENTVTISQDAADTYHFQSSGRIQVNHVSGGSRTLTKDVPVYKLNPPRGLPRGGFTVRMNVYFQFAR